MNVHWKNNGILSQIDLDSIFVVAIGFQLRLCCVMIDGVIGMQKCFPIKIIVNAMKKNSFAIRYTIQNETKQNKNRNINTNHNNDDWARNCVNY